MKHRNFAPLLLFLVSFCTASLFSFASEINSNTTAVIADGGVEISAAEFEAALAGTPDAALEGALEDEGTRYAVISEMMITRKKAALADELREDDPDYWTLQFALQSVKARFISEKLLGETPLPDLNELARERFAANPKKYALVKERRSASHLLISCPPGCDREPHREKLEEVLSELESGANFEEYVLLLSDDTGTANRGGALSESMTFGDPRYVAPFSEALFEIDEVGGYSKVTDTSFGLHIIRLDAIEPERMAPFEEVANVVLAEVVNEFRKLKRREINSQFFLSDDAVIDGEAMDKAFLKRLDESE